MEVTINKEKLVNALNKINKVNRIANFYFNECGFFVQSDSLTNPNEIVNIKLSDDRSEIEPFGTIGNILDVIKSIKSEDITFKINDKSLVIKDDKKKYSLNINKSVHIWEIDVKKTDGISLNIDSILKYIPYMKGISQREYGVLSGFCLKDNMIVSTDSRRLYRVRLPDKLVFSPQIIMEDIKDIFSGEVIFVTDEKKMVFIQNDDYYKVSLIDGSYPDVIQLFDGFSEDKIIKFDKSFLQVVKDAMLLSVKKEIDTLKLEIKDKDINIEFNNDESGSFTTKYSGISGNSEITIGINCEFLKNALDFIFKFDETVTLMYKESNTALYFCTQNKEIEILLMPIRL